MATNTENIGQQMIHGKTVEKWGKTAILVDKEWQNIPREARREINRLVGQMVDTKIQEKQEKEWNDRVYGSAL